MYNTAVNILKNNKSKISSTVTDWIQTNYPDRTNEFEKCSRDISYIIQSLIYCLKENNTFAIDHITTMFFTDGKLELMSVEIEFLAYKFLCKEIENVLGDDIESIEYCNKLINRLIVNFQTRIS